MGEACSSWAGGGQIAAFALAAFAAIGTASDAHAQCAVRGEESCLAADIDDIPPLTDPKPVVPIVIAPPELDPCKLLQSSAEAAVSKIRVDCNGLISQARAAIGQAANITARITAAVTQDVIAAALDGDVQPEVSGLGPLSAGSPGLQSSMFMVSGYKFLSHDGFSSTATNPQLSGSTPEFEEQNYGLTIGTRFDGSALFDAPARSVTLGVLANYTHTDIDVGGSAKVGEASVDSWSAGGFGLVTDGSRYGIFTVVGTFGAPETSSTAILPANAEFHNFGVSTSAATGLVLPVAGAKLDLRGGLNYMHATSDDYSDDAGFQYSDGRIQEFSGSISARLFSVMRVDDATVRPFVQSGITHRFHYENELTISSANNPSVTYSYDDADTTVFARAGIDFDVGQSTQAYLAVRGDASEDVEAIAAQVGVTFKLD